MLVQSQQSLASMTNQEMITDYKQPLLIFSCFFFLSPTTHRSLTENQLENVFWSATIRPAISEQLPSNSWPIVSFQERKIAKYCYFLKTFLDIAYLYTTNWRFANRSWSSRPLLTKHSVSALIVGKWSATAWLPLSDCLAIMLRLKKIGDQKILSHL